MSVRCLTKSTDTPHDKERSVENDGIQGPLESTGRLSTKNAGAAYPRDQAEYARCTSQEFVLTIYNMESEELKTEIGHERNVSGEELHSTG